MFICNECGYRGYGGPADRSCPKCGNRGAGLEYFWICPKCDRHYDYGEYGCVCGYKLEQKSSQGCFISTATMHALNKTDDCHELETFRSFRDNWMNQNHPELVAEYYLLAPGIVKSIDCCSSPDREYRNIWLDYLKECHDLLLSGQYNKAKDKYVQMVEDLRRKFS